MASKQFPLDGFGEITIIKRRTNRNIRLSIKPTGDVVVTIPSWTSYASGQRFAESKLDWILQQVPERTVLNDGQAIGKAHHLQLSPTRGLQKPRSLVSKSSVIVRYPVGMQPDDQAVQTSAELACMRALRIQAEQLLPQRLAQLAEQHDFSYKSVSVKRLKGRWGSCDQHQNIIFNIYLMQLPWECIDYVILHELTHTRIMQHGPVFWDAMQQIIPNLAVIRKQMRSHRPVLYSGSLPVQ